MKDKNKTKNEGGGGRGARGRSVVDTEPNNRMD